MTIDVDAGRPVAALTGRAIAGRAPAGESPADPDLAGQLEKHGRQVGTI